MLGATLGARDRRSGSGNSPNILKAVERAHPQGLISVGVTGFDGGELRSPTHHRLHADVDDMGIAAFPRQVVFHRVIGDLHRRVSAPAR